MIERIAKVLQQLTIRNGGVDRGGWQDYIDDARFVVEQMRTPSMAMVDAVHESEESLLHADGETIEPRLVWGAMIDAALSDKR